MARNEESSDDANIQAVLLLVAYAADNGSPQEVSIHLGALFRMIGDRGGMEMLASTADSALMLQLKAISKSRRLHLTLDCGVDCPGQPRFPEGTGMPEPDMLT